MQLIQWVIYLHLLAVLIWIGSISATGLISVAPLADPVTRGKFALLVYKRLATPAFIVAFLAGSGRLLSDLEFYFRTTHFMHAKLPLALGIIALHHILGVRARRMANGKLSSPGPAAALVAVIVICAALITYLVKFRPF